MRRSLFLGFAFLLTLGISNGATAKISDDLAKELKGYVEKNIAEGNRAVKRASLLTWGYFADEEQQKKIAEYKTADDLDVRVAAGLALWNAGAEDAETFVLKQLQGEANVYPILRDQLTVVADDQEVDVLRKLIEEGKPPHQKATFRYLAAQSGPLYALLTDYLDSKDAKLRSMAFDAARYTARDAALDAVESKLLDSGETAIAKQGLELAIAISHIAGRKDRSVAVLKKAVGHDDNAIAQKAAIRLLELHDKSGVDRLMEFLGSLEEVEERKAIAKALLDNDVSPPADRVKKLHKKAKDEELKQLLLELAVASGDSGMYKKVTKMFGSTHFDKRLAAAKALGHSNEDRAVSMLGKGLFEGNPDMRRSAARSLRQIANKRSLSFLKRAISQERNKDVKIEVVRALGAIGTPDALRILRFNSRTRDRDIKKAIIKAVRDAGHEDGAKTLNLFFSARDLEIQWKSFIAALDVAPKVAMERTEQAFRNPPDGFMKDIGTLSLEKQKMMLEVLLKHENNRVRKRAIRSARRIGEPLFSLIRKFALSDDAPDDVRKAFLLTMAELKKDEDKPRFEKIVRETVSKELRRLAAWTLAEYATPDLEATFRGFLGRDDATLRAIGAYGLATINSATDEE